MHLRLVWSMSIEELVKVLMDERSQWAKVRDELRVMLTTLFKFAKSLTLTQSSVWQLVLQICLNIRKNNSLLGIFDLFTSAFHSCNVLEFLLIACVLIKPEPNA